MSIKIKKIIIPILIAALLASCAVGQMPAAPTLALTQTPVSTPVSAAAENPTPSPTSVFTPTPASTPTPSPTPVPAAQASAPSRTPTRPPASLTPTPLKPTPPPDDVCFVSIDCKRAYDAGFDIAAEVSQKGVILKKTAVTIREGDSVFDALKRVCKEKGVPVGSRSSGLGKYVYSINSLAEMDCGAQSGWMYSVNGAFIQASASECKAQPGDIIKWRYTLENGADLS